MPIKIPDRLPAYETLVNENIFVMHENRAVHQDIRPLKVAIMNLMPTKIATETQILRLIGNTPLQVETVLLHPKTHVSKNTSQEHLLTFYRHFDDVKNEKFDGLIITGAPVETMDFEDVDYWNELTEVMEWSKTNVFSTFHICWGAQAALYYHYNIPKYMLEKKLSGVYSHTLNKRFVKLFRGFDDTFYVPHSRCTTILRKDVEKVEELEILSESEQAGIYVVMSKDGRQVFITGHSEYDPNTLRDEYLRDKAKGLDIDIPENYFPNQDVTKEPIVRWRGHANLLYANWLNYYVYQETPYDYIDQK